MIITGTSVLLKKKNNKFEKNNFKIILFKKFLDQIGKNWQHTLVPNISIIFI